MKGLFFSAVEHAQGLGSLTGKKNTVGWKRLKKQRFGGFGWPQRSLAAQILQDLTLQRVNAKSTAADSCQWHSGHALTLHWLLHEGEFCSSCPGSPGSQR